MTPDPELDDYVRETRDHYRDTEVAGRYHADLSESLPDRVLTALEIRAVRRALYAVPGQPWQLVADVPAGTGKLTKLLSERSQTYVALDISASMMAFVVGAPRIVANAEHLPVRGGEADVVVCLRLLHRVPKTVFVKILAEVIRAASIGCVISYAGAPRSPRLHEALRRLIRRGPYPRHAWTPAGVAAEVQKHGCRVASDRSVSFGLTAERVAPIVVG